LVEIIRSRKGVIFTTHTIEEAEALADHIVILNRGMVAWSGSRDALFSSNVFELYPIEDRERVVAILTKYGCSKVVDMGLTIIVKECDEEILMRVLKEGAISGFRKAGVRAVLIES
jgi:ABC-2 type transport system ATP-binding protein